MLSLLIRYQRSILALLVILSGIPQASALIDDNKQAIEITSDSFEFDNKQGMATYTGNVIANQGSRRLFANKLFVYRDSDGQVNKIVASGAPARFEGKTQDTKPLLHAKALTIEYYNLTELLHLINKAQLEQNGDIYRAPRINYDIAQNTIHSPPSTHGRTTIILQPRAQAKQ